MTESAPEEVQINQQVGGEAHVTTMIGRTDTYINKVVHKNTTIHESASPTPEELFTSAVRYLRSGASRKAASKIEDAVAGNLCSAELAYYWHLAILAGRPFDHLSAPDLDQLKQAREMASRFDGDAWSEATGVVEDLLDCFSQSQMGQSSESHLYDDVMRRFDRLAEVQREELGRHLALLFTGGLQDRLDRERRLQIDAGRMSNDRRGRVPKFFAADPAEPRLEEALPPQIRALHWIALPLGLFICGYFYVSAIGRGGVVNAAWTVIFGATVIISHIGVAIFAMEPLMARAILLGRTRWSIALDAKTWVYRFSPIDQLIADRFFELAPEEFDELAKCLSDVDLQLVRLSDGLTSTYGSKSEDPVSVQEIEWLVRWRVTRLMERWTVEDGMASGRRRSTYNRIDWMTVFLVIFSLSSVALVSTFATQSVENLMVSIALLLLLGVGCRFLVYASPVILERRRFTQDVHENRFLLPLERLAWEQEIETLRDRPSDEEMAEWLDFDKDHVRLEAMKRWGLQNSDVLTHVLLTEAVAGSDSARIVGGPRRYARSLVRLFLLTNNGVRHLDVHIDFDSGAENNERRLAFRYDAIASAQIEEPTVRRGGRRQVASINGGGSDDGQSRPIRRQKLQLTLLNGENLEINADYEKLLAEEDQDNKEALLKLEMETSGAVSTLRTLETVAGEGVDWLRKERERAYYAARRYQETQASNGSMSNSSGLGSANSPNLSEQRLS